MEQDFDLPKDAEDEAFLAQRLLEEAERKELEAAERRYGGLMSFKVTLDYTQKLSDPNLISLSSARRYLLFLNNSNYCLTSNQDISLCN